MNTPIKYISLIFLLLLATLFTACANAASDQTVAEADTETPLPADTEEPPAPTETPTSEPTATEAPTDTPEPPTETPTPEPTATEAPTDTPEPPTETPTPTDTPVPTDTPTPENTPTPLPPTATPTPETSAALEAFEQGVEYFEQDAYDEAIAQFQEVINLEPDFSIAYAYLGYSYAFGPEDFDKAIETLETYLNLSPEAADRTDVEQDIQLMREAQASQADTQFDIPPGMALFVFKNYSGEDWNVDIGTYFLEVPANPPDREYTYTTIPIEPGTYTWQAHSVGGGYYITDSSGNRAFEFTVAEGEVEGTQCCR